MRDEQNKVEQQKDKPSSWLNILGFVLGGASSVILCIPTILLVLWFGWPAAIIISVALFVGLYFWWRTWSVFYKQFSLMLLLGVLIGFVFIVNGLSYLRYVNIPW